jgi:PAS domain S-box-containing protein
MGTLLTLLNSSTYLRHPNSIIGWAALVFMLLLLGFLLYYWRALNKPWGRVEIRLFILLSSIALLTNLFLGLRVHLGEALPLPGMPIDDPGQTAMVFGFIPWILAGGLLGPLPAVILALFSGLLQAFFGNHDPYLPIQLALLAVLFSAAINQRYRTLPYRALRQPILASLVLALIFPFLYLIFTPMTTPGLFVSGLDYTLASLPDAWLAMTIQVLVAGLCAQLIAVRWSAAWGEHGPLLPSPTERSLEARFFYSLAPLGLLVFIATLVGGWMLATRSAKEMLRAQMTTTANLVAESVPHFLVSGENLITHLASDPRLASQGSTQPSELRRDTRRDTLSELIKYIPFFDQLILTDDQGNPISIYPDPHQTGVQMPSEAQTPTQFALSNLPVHYYIIPPDPDEEIAKVSFIAAIPGSEGNVNGVLIGRSGLENNPMTQTLVASLLGLSSVNGQGMLLDRDKRILVHPDPSLIMTEYDGPSGDKAQFYDAIGSDGTRRMIYYLPITGEEWAVVLDIPAHLVQQYALKVMLPLLAMLTILSALVVVVLHLGLHLITDSLKGLTNQADALVKGNFEEPLDEPREDEIGQLQRAFARLRNSQKARLDELNRLLAVSYGVASSSDISEAIQPILESVLTTGAHTTRMVLAPEALPGLDEKSAFPNSFSLGAAKDRYSDLDDQILAYTRQQERLVLSSLTRQRLLDLSPSRPYPASLIALSLRQDNQYLGALWVAYAQPHSFSDEEVRFLTTLASQAALAISNTRSFMNSEFARQRLTAILDSSPDPVLVTDQQDRLILANPAAWKILGLGINSELDQPLEKIITQTQLLELLRDPNAEKRSAEISVRKGQVFLAAVSPVISDGLQIGRVCILRDVTRFKDRDVLKSEFVSTVSHDLRSPLSLMRGYAAMIEMVGQLNEQQSSFVRKIIAGVDNMTHLVSNLLDLGRIETGIGLQLATVSPDEIIEQVVSDLQMQAQQKKIQLTIEIPDRLPTIQVDPALLRQALQNLVDNAIKFTPNEGNVTIRIQASEERIIFEVRDTGIGISPMDQARIFDKFYRGPQHISAEPHGSALGLAIVKSIAERHNGQVRVESHLGKGSTFYLAIPLRHSVNKKGAAPRT